MNTVDDYLLNVINEGPGRFTGDGKWSKVAIYPTAVATSSVLQLRNLLPGTWTFVLVLNKVSLIDIYRHTRRCISIVIDICGDCGKKEAINGVTGLTEGLGGYHQGN